MGDPTPPLPASPRPLVTVDARRHSRALSAPPTPQRAHGHLGSVPGPKVRDEVLLLGYWNSVCP